jgi:hypothetical protein
LMCTEDLADSVLLGADTRNWTLSTKSDCEEDRAIKFTLYLKKVKKTTQTLVKDQTRKIAEAEMQTKLEAQSSLVQIDMSNVAR